MMSLKPVATVVSPSPLEPLSWFTPGATNHRKLGLLWCWRGRRSSHWELAGFMIPKCCRSSSNNGCYNDCNWKWSPSWQSLVTVLLMLKLLFSLTDHLTFKLANCLFPPSLQLSSTDSRRSTVSPKSFLAPVWTLLPPDKLIKAKDRTFSPHSGRPL